MLGREWKLDMNGTFSWTPSINESEPMSPADQSVGKQLPYVPEFSAAVTGCLSWRTWSLLYKWCYYSQRYTMSSNDYTLTGYLPPYFMNNVTLEKQLSFRWADLSLKGSINNLFDEEYLSVLSRPMPGINSKIVNDNLHQYERIKEFKPDSVAFSGIYRLPQQKFKTQ